MFRHEVSVGMAQMPVRGLTRIPITLDGAPCVAIVDTRAKVLVFMTRIANLLQLQLVPDTVAPAIVVARGQKIWPARVGHTEVGYMGRMEPHAYLMLLSLTSAEQAGAQGASHTSGSAPWLGQAAPNPASCRDSCIQGAGPGTTLLCL